VEISSVFGGTYIDGGNLTRVAREDPSRTGT